MKIYLIRHGKSEANRKNLYQSPDNPLSKIGIRQAKILARRVRNIQVDFIYSSDLERAQQTAEIISQETGKKIEYWKDLRELKRPSVLMGKSDDDPESKKYVRLMTKNYKNPKWKYSDDESYQELKTRAQKVLAHILKKHNSQNVLLVSHGAMIKMITSLVIFGKNLSPSIFWSTWHHLWIKNTGISVCEYREEQWVLVSWNDISHFAE